MDWKRVTLCLLSLVVLFSLALGEEDGSQEAPPIPGWIENINPADYALLASDLHEPFVFVDIEAQANSTGYALVTSEGLERQNTTFLELLEYLTLLGMRENCGGSLSLRIVVFETPEQAVALCQEEFKDFGFTEDYQGFTPGYNGLKDPRLEGVGASSTRGHIVQYKNMVAHIQEWGCVSEIPEGTIASLARLWLDKVSKIRDVEKPDLHVEPDSIYLSNGTVKNTLPYEIAADQQAVKVEIENRGKVEAKNVQLQLYLQKGEEYQPLGRTVPVGDIPPNETRAASTFWDLEKQNVKDAVLLAQAFIPGEQDENEEDNYAAVRVSIYYAFNGNRAYSWIDDAYRFDNYDFSGRETEEMVEGLLATVVGNMEVESLPQIMERLLFPSTFMRFWNYTQLSMQMGAGGHCYGMAATSAVYFMDPSQKPRPGLVSQMTLEEASTNIAIYHRAQLLPLWRVLLSDSGSLFSKRTSSPSNCHQAVKGALMDSREPLIIEFFGEENNRRVGHAVLAYKLIEVEGRDPVIYVYDPNFPEPEVWPPRPMSQIILELSKNNWKNPGYMGYMWAYAHDISAHRVFREIPLQEVNALVPALKKDIYDMMEIMRQANQIMAVLRCPADALFTDDQGRRVGTVDGQIINEIPGAEVLSQGEVEIYQLPAKGRYALGITATADGTASLDVIVPEDGSAALTSFQDISVTAGSRLSGTLEPQGKIGSLQSGTETIKPTLQGSLDLTGFEAETSESDLGEDGISAGEEIAEEEQIDGEQGEGGQGDESQGEVLILEIDSLGGVDNSPTSPSKLTLDQPFTITKIRTYHWNYGSGQTPGTIALQDEGGNLYGPWQARGEPGMGGVPDAYWVVEPDVDLQPGEYTVVDSDPATWSQNYETDGRGITLVWGTANKLPYART